MTRCSWELIAAELAEVLAHAANCLPARAPKYMRRWYGEQCRRAAALLAGTAVPYRHIGPCMRTEADAAADRCVKAAEALGKGE